MRTTVELNNDSNTVFLFGPYVVSFTKQSLEKLIRPLEDGPHRDWILDAVAGLPSYWDALAKKIPEVAETIPGARLLADLDSWLRHGLGDGPNDVILPSIIVGPLFVLLQLSQYWSYLELKQIDKSKTDPQADLVARQKQQGGNKVEVLGFCAGLLAALPVASANNQEEFQKYSSVAVRLAMLIGGLVDAREEWDKGVGKGGSVSYAVAWRGIKQGEEMMRIVKDLSPEAYVSVLYDEARATVSTSERTGPKLVRQMRAKGITVAEVGLKGYIHSPDPDRSRHTDALVDLCSNIPDLQFADAASLALPTYDNLGSGKPVSSDRGSMTEMVLRAIMVQQCQWFGTFSKAMAGKDDHFVVTFGMERCVPPTLMRQLGPRWVHFEDVEKELRQQATIVAEREVQLQLQLQQQQQQQQLQQQQHLQQLQQQDQIQVKANMSQLGLDTSLVDSDAIAVVGMSIKTAGADDLDEFADMLKTGKSQHEEIGPDKLMFDSLFREVDRQRKWYGNFMRDTDAFDHKFFKRSPRESAAMDPQQRLVLQAAYHAVEQSGYFTENTPTSGTGGKNHVGVYIGSCGVDYEHNMATHTPSAFTATGGLKSFICGRVSHHFGWTGPSMTFDAACASSALAIHTACRNLLSGECKAALAGGVNTMTNMLWFQNLSAGSFLSPTGQCKPFDEAADGYCRAEGLAFVFLKKLSDAVADGNPVLATINSSAVYQNENCTPLFVPNSPSLSHLFKDVLRQAKVSPKDVSLVEAHGTGTPVGDPAEYESVRLALGGPIRDSPLTIGSIKGHIGHTEGASGAIALVKIITMMRGGFIPPQASHTKMNHHIEVRPDDMMEVVTSLRPWKEDRKIALLNNYGACGSNASMIVAQSPFSANTLSPIRNNSSGDRFPFWMTGLDARSIAAYSSKLASYLRSCAHEATLADVSFHMNRQSNRALPQGLIFSCRSLTELDEKLEQVASHKDAAAVGIAPVKAERPVILCFGGQVSTFVGLDKKLYGSMAVLRRHLDECDAVVTSLGLGSIFPDIFAREPMQDTVKLQTMLLAMQYACAKSWMNCGLEAKVVAVVGHSFGELTALCVSGVLSLEDTVRLVAGRAKLVRDAWGLDSGAMMAVEADETLVDDLLAEVNGASDGSVSIACYNGPRSFTIAGSTKAIDHVAATLASDSKFLGIKSKRLNVTNAFHSTLVEPLVDRLELVGKDLVFNEPVIPLERATEHKLNGKMNAKFVPEHMRRPVFFNHAIQRLAKQHPQAIFLEAGSNSTITVMASRALAASGQASAHHFQAMAITNDKGLDGLTDTTVALWKQGLRVSFWAHQAVQTQEYASLLLPPYQFDKSRHWLEFKSPMEAVNKAVSALVADNPARIMADQDPKTMAMWSFVGYQENGNKKPRFRINTESDKYKKFVSPHMIAQTAPICPGTLETDMAIEALFSLHPDWREAGIQPVVLDMANDAPICVDPSRVFHIDFEPLNDAEMLWEFTIISASAANNKDIQLHAKAKLHFRSTTDPAYLQEFARLERQVSHARCQAMLGLDLDDDDVDVLQGRNVYRAFSEVVDYGELYRGVRCVVGRSDECAGRVQKRHQGQTWLDVPLSDCFSQVAGMWVNLMTDLPPGDMYIATACEMSMRSPKVTTMTEGKEQGPDMWHIFARHSRQSDKLYVSDLFVFDAATGTLTEVMLGLQYGRVAKASMSKMLSRMTTDESVVRIKAAATSSSATHKTTTSVPAAVPAEAKPAGGKKKKSSGRDITEEVRNLVSMVSGIEASEMTLDSEMADLGIDSLMGMELAREVEMVFKCELDQAEQMEATTLRQFVACVSNALFGPGHGGAAVIELEDDEQDSSSADGEDKWSESTSGPETGISTPDEKPEPELIPKSQANTGPVISNLTLSRSDILESFGEVKMLSDKLIREHHLDAIDKNMLAGTNRLCAALVVEAFDELGSPLRTAAPGEVLERVPFLPQHSRLMEFVYRFLEEDARLINIDDVSGQVTRTHIAAPRKTSQVVLQELVTSNPEFVVPNRLTYYAGSQLAGVLSGKTDGIRVIFGSAEGRERVQALYCDYDFNRMGYKQMRDTIGHVADRIRTTQPGETLKVLEMGAGTGGTTNFIAPFLASLGIPVEYTFTDLSPSMVANARRKFGKQYSFMRFTVHDIEKAPANELRGAHVVLASNAIHATHNLVTSLSNIRQALRPDGFLMMLEMTEIVPFIDLVFGLLEGWWFYDDGRTHAVIPAEYWERELHTAGFGHVDWTDGSLPENQFQKVIMAVASGTQEERLPKPAPESNPELELGDVETRETVAEQFVAKYTQGWATPKLHALVQSQTGTPTPTNGSVVVVTGATGSLGSHLVQVFAENPGVSTVVCINRRTSMPVDKRQAEALSSRGIELSPLASSKLRVFETDTSKPQFGFPDSEYAWIVQHGTHVVHNAWPMSGTRPLGAFEPQLQTLRNLLDLARDMATRDTNKVRVGFQFVSSIGVVGHAGEARVLERRVPMSAALPGGYTEAKWVCERMLEETLHKFPQLFRPMVVRPGQIAGSATSGFWNPAEHFAFIVKSSQSLRAWPDLDGVLQWVPVNDVAATCMDLLRIGDTNAPEAYPVYHIDNPVGQPWKAMSPVLATALDIPPNAIVPFKSWVKLVRRSPLHAEAENPAVRLIDWLDDNFERMSCGGLILDTAKAQEHSKTMALEGPVSPELARRFVAAWKKMGFLNP